jgi:hypothetical protein
MEDLRLARKKILLFTLLAFFTLTYTFSSVDITDTALGDIIRIQAGKPGIHDMIRGDAVDSSKIDVIGYDNHKGSTNEERRIERKDLSGAIQPPTIPAQPPTLPQPTSVPMPCIIATATYGSSMDPEVYYMRHVRDNVIGSSKVGKSMVDAWNTFYYSWSPPIAEFIAKYSFTKPIFQVLLMPLVAIIHVTNSVYSIAAYVNMSFASIVSFIFAAFSSITFYVLIPLWIFSIFLMKRFR